MFTLFTSHCIIILMKLCRLQCISVCLGVKFLCSLYILCILRTLLIPIWFVPIKKPRLWLTFTNAYLYINLSHSENKFQLVQLKQVPLVGTWHIPGKHNARMYMAGPKQKHHYMSTLNIILNHMCESIRVKQEALMWTLFACDSYFTSKTNCTNLKHISISIKLS